MIAEQYGSEVNKIGCYECSQCGRVTRTVQRIAGVVPMGIECPYCHGDSFFTEDSYPNIGVTHEWYRPALDEVLAMTEGRLFTVNFVLSGGLLRRECSRG
jgi:hypothetical protein